MNVPRSAVIPVVLLVAWPGAIFIQNHDGVWWEFVIFNVMILTMFLLGYGRGYTQAKRRTWSSQTTSPMWKDN